MSNFKQKKLIGKRMEYEKESINDIFRGMNKYHFAEGHANVGSCVQESQIFKMLLKKHKGLKSKLVCSDIYSWNEMGKIVVANWNIEKDDETSLKIMESQLNALELMGCPAPYLTECGHDTVSMKEGGYQGHVVVETEFFVVDITAGQFNRERLCPIPHYMVWEKSHFIPFAEHKENWLLEQRPNFPTVVRESRECNGELKEPTGVRHDDLPPIVVNESDETAVCKVGDWTMIMLSLRPDLHIEATYARWNKKSFREGTRRTAAVIGLMIDDQKKR
tara:strand:+ start:3288 stop:4115 length:828 start_codon:yes stop_codon:yes gene_type:complete